jgi:hypothetical protein
MAKLNLKSIRAMQIREAFQQIYVAESTQQFEGLLNDWYYWATHSQLAPLPSSLRTWSTASLINFMICCYQR